LASNFEPHPTISILDQNLNDNTQHCQSPPKGNHMLGTSTKSRQCSNIATGSGLVSMSAGFFEVWSYLTTISPVVIVFLM